MSEGLNTLSRSYPFLGLSRLFNEPYERVLRAADFADKFTSPGYNPAWAKSLAEYSGVSLACAPAVLLVCGASWRWQFPPEGRGL